MYHEEAEQEDYHDALNDLAAELISDANYEPFLTALFRTDADTWVRATHLCREVTPLRQRIQALERRAVDEGYPQEARLSVRWQHYGDEFCLVTFFLDVNLWNCMHVINPASFQS